MFLLPDCRVLDYHTYSNIWHQVLGDYMSQRKNYTFTESDYWRPHSSRKIFATLSGETSVPVTVAASLLSHASETMSFNYIASTRETASAGMEGVAERLLGSKA